MAIRALLAALILLPDGLTVQEFEKLHRELQPPKDEPWLSIPWKTSLLEARDLAAAQKKPILLWSMDGHPLGCGWNNVIIGRVSLFSDPEIIALLKDQFIPAAVDNHHIEKQKDAEGDFYRSVARHQGEYIFTAEGKMLGSTNTHSASHLKGLMMKALKDFQPPDAPSAAAGAPDGRFQKSLPAGGLVVKVTTKVLGGYEKGKSRNAEIYQDAIGRDNLWIEAEEAQALAAGKVPDSVKKRIASYHLVDNTRGEPPWWRRDEIRKAELEIGKDGAVTGAVHLETAKGDRGFVGEILGVATVTEGKLTRFDLVAKGEAWGAGRYNGNQPPGKYPLAFAFTISEARTAADRLLPQGACRGNLAGYFAP